MTWSEAEETFRTMDTVILPVGTYEQHGRHLPLGTDSLIADRLAKEVARRAGVVVAPLMPYGCSPNHSEYAGTLSISRDAFQRTVQDICYALVSHGAKRIIFMNGHGGNHFPLHEIGVGLRRDGILSAIVEWWKISGRLHEEGASTGHAELSETALLMSVWDGTVNISDAVCLPIKRRWTGEIFIESLTRSRFRDIPLDIPLLTKDVAPSGSWGNSPDTATKELGNRMLELLVEYIAAFARDFDDAQPPS